MRPRSSRSPPKERTLGPGCPRRQAISQTGVYVRWTPMARPSTAAAAAARYMRSSEPAAAKAMLAGYSLAPVTCWPGPPSKSALTRSGISAAFCNRLSKRATVAWRPAVEDEHAHPVIAGQGEPAVETRIVVRDIAADGVHRDDLGDLLLQRQPGQGLLDPGGIVVGERSGESRSRKDPAAAPAPPRSPIGKTRRAGTARPQ